MPWSKKVSVPRSSRSQMPYDTTVVVGTAVVVVGSGVVGSVVVSEVVSVDVVVTEVVGVDVVVAEVVGVDVVVTEVVGVVVVGSTVVVVGRYWAQSELSPPVPIVCSSSLVRAPRRHLICTVLQPHSPVHTMPHWNCEQSTVDVVDVDVVSSGQ